MIFTTNFAKFFYEMHHKDVEFDDEGNCRWYSPNREIIDVLRGCFQYGVKDDVFVWSEPIYV